MQTLSLIGNLLSPFRKKDNEFINSYPSKTVFIIHVLSFGIMLALNLNSTFDYQWQRWYSGIAITFIYITITLLISAVFLFLIQKYIFKHDVKYKYNVKILNLYSFIKHILYTLLRLLITSKSVLLLCNTALSIYSAYAMCLHIPDFSLKTPKKNYWLYFMYHIMYNAFINAPPAGVGFW